MGRELTHDEVTDLLGAYALDALEPPEHEAVDRHVQSCPACLREVAEHREVAGLLTPGWGKAPTGVWDRIAASLEESPPPLDMAPVIALKPREPVRTTGGGFRRGAAAAIAAMVAVAAVTIVGVVAIRAVNDDSPGYATQLARSVHAARDVSGSRSIELASTDGRRSAEAVVLPDGTGYLVGDDLPALTRERTYQLWAVVGSSTISVGVLGPEPKVVPFKMDGSATALAITEETAGGVVSSRQSPVAVGKLI